MSHSGIPFQPCRFVAHGETALYIHKGRFAFRYQQRDVILDRRNERENLVYQIGVCVQLQFGNGPAHLVKIRQSRDIALQFQTGGIRRVDDTQSPDGYIVQSSLQIRVNIEGTTDGFKTGDDE